MENIIIDVYTEKVEFILRDMGEKKAREFVKLLERAYQTKPHEKDIQGLQEWLNDNPGMWRIVFDASRVIEANLIQRMISHRAAHLALAENAKEMRRDMGYEEAPPVMKLLIDNIIVSWLRCQWIEYQLVLLMGQENSGRSTIEFWEKRLSTVQRRYLHACETLTKVHRLLAGKAAMQVNVATNGGQQVNVAGDLVKIPDRQMKSNS